MDKNSALRIIKNRKYAAEERAYEINLHLSGFERFGKLTALIHKLTIDEIKGDFSARQKKIVAEKELSEFLASLGFSEEDLKPRYFCKKCGDTGFYEGLPCKCLTELMGGTERSRGDEMTFENAEPSINSKFMDYCRKYADNSEECKLNLFVYGAAGYGQDLRAQCDKKPTSSKRNRLGFILFRIRPRKRVPENSSFRPFFGRKSLERPHACGLSHNRRPRNRTHTSERYRRIVFQSFRQTSLRSQTYGRDDKSHKCRPYRKVYRAHFFAAYERGKHPRGRT